MSVLHDPRLVAILETIDLDAVTQLTSQLVQIPSVTGREGLEISEFIASWFENEGIPSGLQHVAPGRANVFARLDGTQPGPRLLLNGHLDTKPGDGMIVDPFGGLISDGRVWGRGSCDMKGPVASLMIAMRAVAQSGLPLKGTLLFGSEVGEDGGGWKFEELLTGPCQCDLGICAEPTNLEVHIGCRGSFPLRIHTHGRTTHTGTAYEGINPILKMSKVIPTLYDLPCFHLDDPIWGRPPINAMIIRGGGQVSASVPENCMVHFDIRLNPDLPPERLGPIIEDALHRLQAEDPELKLTVETTWEVDGRSYASIAASALSADHALVAAMSTAAETVLGTQPKLAGFPGGCSTAIMLRHGIPSVVFGPGNLRQAHSVDEWINAAQLAQAARAYAALAYQTLVDQP
ncbi:MAG: M20/M25/M40 family metallo-hydrolase [Chloroflexi bacterium]|nr:M20/M25/M40 family metallo-hydrolase [Chloroflexota bacterium]